MSDDLSDAQLARIVTAVETIEAGLGVLVEKRDVDREAYKRERDRQDVRRRNS